MPGKRSGFGCQAVFPVLATGQVVSGLGSGIAIFAIQWELWTRLESGLVLALLWVFVAIPYIVMGFIACVCVDRWDRKKIIMGSNLLNGLIATVA